ncbi:polyhydroxyalkanoate depolymerase [Methyloligella sp. 2.7D]|uniref:polyhydroxyalkanoate depolymerase n=1 Tax=unclassified Methyloligella TaxID=2625955 RepID=UPI00157DAAA2|nr:polyhydroxyalkanoate depolymerase [Methyloligella sp. GL2]QKP76037.1 polyhydroxyalkanoate depolymerase [Methyloligella sp. GL2]
MLYHLYEFNHAALSPARAAADAYRLMFRHPLNPASHTPLGRTAAAALELFERTTRRYRRPAWRIDEVTVDGVKVPVRERTLLEKPFCRLVHFERDLTGVRRKRDNKVLIVAPMAGHFPTLLRGTVRDMLAEHDVYVTEWEDARNVPLAAGSFDLNDYVDYIVDFLRFFGGDVHVMAVCQPTVPVFVAVSLMEAAKDPAVPNSMILMAGPLDVRESPTAVNCFAHDRGLDWFKRNVITQVPFPNPGVMRDVYPGFLQLTGFMGMNLDRHITAHRDLFQHLVQGDGDSAEKHREFYDEFLAVMDLTAEFYLQTIDEVFLRHTLPSGEMTHRGVAVDPSKIERVALMTVEGEKDDIAGIGQTKAAHTMAKKLPDNMREHYEQPGVGHYGVFNGSRYRAEIVPRIRDFIAMHNRKESRLARAFGNLIG